MGNISLLLFILIFAHIFLLYFLIKLKMLFLCIRNKTTRHTTRWERKHVFASFRKKVAEYIYFIQNQATVHNFEMVRIIQNFNAIGYLWEKLEILDISYQRSKIMLFQTFSLNFSYFSYKSEFKNELSLF